MEKNNHHALLEKKFREATHELEDAWRVFNHCRTLSSQEKPEIEEFNDFEAEAVYWLRRRMDAFNAASATLREAEESTPVNAPGNSLTY